MSIRRITLPLLVVAATLVGCATPIAHQRTVGFVDPPYERAQASSALERIKVSDVLEFRLPDDSTATLNGVYQVAADGTIEVSGSTQIQVAGKTLEEAQQAVQEALAASSAVRPAIVVSRHDYFVVTITSESAQTVTHTPLKDKVVVMDALANVPQLSGKVIWIARPFPGQSLKHQILAIDWEGIAHGNDRTTNYPLRAGDFVMVADEPVQGAGRVFGAVTSMFAPSGQASPPATASTPIGKPAISKPAAD
jgi:hypothetical protein